MNPLAHFLQSELNKRKAKNNRYSLRAFARALQVEPSALSKFINEQRVPSMKIVNRLLKNLEVSEKEYENIRHWVSQFQMAKKEFISFDEEELENQIQIHHLLVLEGLRLPAFAQSLDRLRQYLRMESTIFFQILQDLEKMNLITCEWGHCRTKTPKAVRVSVPRAITSEKMKSIQIEFLKMAYQALEKTPVQFRHNSTMTVAIPSESLECFVELLNKIKHRINLEAEKRKEQADSVYNFTFAIYPLLRS